MITLEQALVQAGYRQLGSDWNPIGFLPSFWAKASDASSYHTVQVYTDEVIICAVPGGRCTISHADAIQWGKEGLL